MYNYSPEHERGGVATVRQAVRLEQAEITAIWYWDPSVGYYNPSLTEPPTILIGTEAGAQFIVTNLSNEYLDLGILITAFDPLGNPLGASIAGPISLPPGGTFGHQYRVITERPGIYTFTTDIITSPAPPYGTIGPTLSWPVAYVVGEIPPLAGHVYDPVVHDVTTGETFYSLSLPVEIDGDHDVIVGIHWMNDGDETATFTPTFELIDPDGISRELQTFDTVLSPSGHTGGQTASSVKLDKAGMWKIHAILKAEGTLLDEKTWDAISVTAAPPPPEYRGTITKMKLEYDGAQALIPVSNITQGASALLRVTGRNDTPDAQRMGITWLVYDPLGRVVNQYAAWEDWPFTGGGKEHEFHKFGGEFTLSEEGEYTTTIWLLMNPDDPVTVDSYEGVLCTVVKEVIPPECAIDADCPEGYVCVAGKCVPVEVYKLVQHTEYPEGKIYVGKAEQCTFDFKLTPEQIPGTAWLGTAVAEAIADAVAKQDAEMLDLKIYEDTTPVFWTNYRVIATATASPVPWAIIIPLVLVILFIVALTFLIREVKTIDWGKAAVPIAAIWIGIAALVGAGIFLAAAKKKKERA